MVFSAEIEAFINDFVNELLEQNVAIFAGAGMSVERGFVDWRDLLKDIAVSLNLQVDRESDLILVAQFSENEVGHRADLNKKILQDFTDEAELGENHRILARLPITTFWTTNYDTLIEDSLREANKRADVKHEPKQLSSTKPRRDAVVYKMHGDVDHPDDAIITKKQYQSYYLDHERFITALAGDLVSKTFLFIGFSFTDPNLEYVLGRLNEPFAGAGKKHYTFLKRPARADFKLKVEFDYAVKRQPLVINELKRYKITTLQIDKYEDITDVLREIEHRYRKHTVFISGSAEEYGSWNRFEAQEFIHKLSKEIIKARFTIVNGFGWGVGSAVINGALEAIVDNPKKYSDEQLILRPFPQFKTGDKNLFELWQDYRERMIPLAGIGIFMFGNKLKEGVLINADGVRKEFDIAIRHGLVPIPIGASGYETKLIFDDISSDPAKYYGPNKWIFPLIEEISRDGLRMDNIVKKVISILKKLQEQ